MAYVIPSAEYVDIDGVPLLTPAWVLTDAAQLWGSGEVRGDDLVIPHADGARARVRRPTVTRLELELKIVGDYDWEGLAQSDVRLGLQRNIDHLLTNVVAAPAAPGTRTLTLHYPTGSTPATKTGAVHVQRLRLTGAGDYLAVGQLELSFPNGGLKAPA